MQVIGYSSNLTIFISNTTKGTYTCHVSVQGYPGIESSAQVYQKGPPQIVKSVGHGVQYGSVGETVELVCEWVSMPVAEKAVWRYNDFPVLGKTEHYQVLTRRHSTGSIVSTLIIKDSTPSDFGIYNCSATNQYGHTSALIQLQRKGR